MIAYFDCFSGVSGDMTLGALVDAGLPLAELRADLSRLDLAGYRLEAEQRTDQGIHGTELRVEVDGDRQPARRLSEILALLEASRLDGPVAQRAAAVFRRLARAEAAVHGVPPEDVHFHEVGAVDAIVDVVGAVLGLRALGVESVYASALPLGTGSIASGHGILPLPAPGTLALLAEVGAPTRPAQTDKELVTPTGAALLAELATFEHPPITLRKIGYGFGRRRLPWPNCLRVWLGDGPAPDSGRDEVSLLEANLDDMTGEALGFALERLFAAGALDVFFTPIQMKKGRPAVMLSALARPSEAPGLASLILANTSTLGVRVARLDRIVAQRELGMLETELGPVAVKIKHVGGSRIVSPEYEDAARIARERGIPLAEVYRSVLRAELPGEH